MNLAAKGLVLCSLTVGFGAQAAVPAAQTQPGTSSCRVTTYYADASKKEKVGSVSLCLTGHKTRYSSAAISKQVERRVAPVEQPQEPTYPEDSGGMACEWPFECANERPTPVEPRHTPADAHGAPISSAN